MWKKAIQLRALQRFGMAAPGQDRIETAPLLRFLRSENCGQVVAKSSRARHESVTPFRFYCGPLPEEATI